jgi:hypothetical protein
MRNLLLFTFLLVAFFAMSSGCGNKEDAPSVFPPIITLKFPAESAIIPGEVILNGNITDECLTMVEIKVTNDVTGKEYINKKPNLTSQLEYSISEIFTPTDLKGETPITIYIKAENCSNRTAIKVVKFKAKPLTTITFYITRAKDGKPIPNVAIALYKDLPYYQFDSHVRDLGFTNELGILEWKHPTDSLIPKVHHFRFGAKGYNSGAIYVTNASDKNFKGVLVGQALVQLHTKFTDTVPQKCICYHDFFHKPNVNYPANNVKSVLMWTKGRTQLDTTLIFEIASDYWFNKLVCYKLDPNYAITASDLILHDSVNAKKLTLPDRLTDTTLVVDCHW